MRITALLTALSLATSFASAELTHIEHNDILVTNTMHGKHYSFRTFMKLVKEANRRQCNLTDCEPRPVECDRLFCITFDAKITGMNNAGDTYTSAFQVFNKAGTFKNIDTKVCEPGNSEKCHVEESTEVTLPQGFKVLNKLNEKKEIFDVEFVMSINDKPPKKKGKKADRWVNHGKLIQSSCEEMEKVFANVTDLVHPTNSKTFGPITVNCKAKVPSAQNGESSG